MRLNHLLLFSKADLIPAFHQRCSHFRVIPIKWIISSSLMILYVNCVLLINGRHDDFLRFVNLIMLVRKILKLIIFGLLFCCHIHTIRQIGRNSKIISFRFIAKILITAKGSLVLVLSTRSIRLPGHCINLIQIIGKKWFQIILRLLNGLPQRQIQQLVRICRRFFSFDFPAFLLFPGQFSDLIVQIPVDGKLPDHI